MHLVLDSQEFNPALLDLNLYSEEELHGGHIVVRENYYYWRRLKWLLIRNRRLIVPGKHARPTYFSELDCYLRDPPRMHLAPHLTSCFLGWRMRTKNCFILILILLCSSRLQAGLCPLVVHQVCNDHTKQVCLHWKESAILDVSAKMCMCDEVCA